MHDIGRTQQEYAGETQEFQPETFEFGQAGEVLGEALGESFEAGLHETGAQETGAQETGSFETFETYESQESPLHEALEMELATELLEITNEDELDRFLGKLIRSVGRGIGRFVRSPLARTLGGVLKRVAKVALPVAGKALGTFFAGPLGGMVGGQLANVAGRAFGLELEGMSSEDAEFEVARRFVRFASAAVNNASTAAPTADPRAAAQAAATAAARRYAPGLVRGNVLAPTVAGAPSLYPPTVPCPGARRRGVWIRRGRRILLLGV